MWSDCVWDIGECPHFQFSKGPQNWVWGTIVQREQFGAQSFCVHFDVAYFNHHLCLEISIQDRQSHRLKLTTKELNSVFIQLVGVLLCELCLNMKPCEWCVCVPVCSRKMSLFRFNHSHESCFLY